MLSPLRYPGGKTTFTPILENFIRTNEIKNASYYEPYAGGAGAGLKLLNKEIVSDIHLNDLDYSIYSIWYCMLNYTDQFIDKIASTDINITEWESQKEIYRSPKSHTRFELGFATFFLNRCNRSGIIKGAGVIGGKAQNGNYKMDARFNKESLISKILYIQSMKKCINIYNRDAHQFIVQDIPKTRKNTFIYIDPPYIEQGKKLYMDKYDIIGHQKLALYLESLKRSNWLISYDAHKLLNGFYLKSKCIRVKNLANLSNSIRKSEVIFHPHHLKHTMSLK